MMAVFLTVAAAVKVGEKIDVSFTSLVQYGLSEEDAKEKHKEMFLVEAPHNEGWSNHNVTLLEFAREDLIEFVLHADPREGADEQLVPN